MYRIMLVKSAKENYGSLYQYMTQTIGTVVTPVEYSTKTELNTAVESLLNDGGYAKSDFIVVQVVDYTIEATDYTDEDDDDEDTTTTTDTIGTSDSDDTTTDTTDDTTTDTTDDTDDTSTDTDG